MKISDAPDSGALQNTDALPLARGAKVVLPTLFSWVKSRIQATGLDASTITTGTFDIARLPVLPSGEQVISSGGLAELSSGQRGAISKGAIVTTTDGRRFLYSGTGDKTLEASYIVLADVTPDWNAIAGKPSAFNADQIQSVPVAAATPTNGQALLYNSTMNQYEPGTVAAGGGGGNSALSIDVSSAASPLALSAAQVAASTLIFTGTRSAALDVVTGDALASTMLNRTSQTLNVLPVAGSNTRLGLSDNEARAVLIDGNDVWFGPLLSKGFAPPASGLQLWLKGDVPEPGTVWTDQSGRSNNGAISGATWGANGLLFDGNAGNNVNFGTCSDLNATGDFSICAWITTPDTFLDSYPQIFTRATGGQDGFNLYVNNSQRIGFILLLPGRGWGTDFVGTPAAVALNTSYFVCGVREGATLRLYLNGAEVATTASATGAVDYGTSPTAEAGQKPGGNYWTGAIGDVFHYNRAITPAEALALYEGTV